MPMIEARITRVVENFMMLTKIKLKVLLTTHILKEASKKAQARIEDITTASF